MRLSSPRPSLIGWLGLGLLLACPSPGWSRPRPDAPESTYVKLLKKAPDARLGTIIEAVGKRGTADDLAYLLDRSTSAEPTAFAGPSRRQALEALGVAASTRNLRPTGDLDRLNRLIELETKVDPATRATAIRLAGTWRLASAVPGLIVVAETREGIEPPTRLAAISTLAAIGTDPVRAAIDRLAGPGTDRVVQRAAIAALARLDVAAAADRAAAVIAQAAPEADLAPLIAAFLDLQGGGDKLTSALNRHPPTPDAARLALRAVAALGRSDEALVARLSQIAGIDPNPNPPTPPEMQALIAQVSGSGDPARGERIFRRPEINCTQCHALGGAGGGIGPDLSAIGLSSPVDYIINSILIPDQAIKEEYQTRVILTDDGRVAQGIVVEEDDRRVVLKDALGNRLVIATSTIEDSKRGGSLMPKGLVSTLTRAEFVDLVRFVAELGRPGPYAIRSTPTIQRWRALHPVPPALQESARLDPATLRDEVLGTAPESWTPLYAWTSGNLPSDEILAVAGGPVGVVQGELTVSAPGLIRFDFGLESHSRLAAWLDDRPLTIGLDGGVTSTVEPGAHKLTIRVDATVDRESVGPIRVEVQRVPGSTAEFSVVGGR